MTTVDPQEEFVSLPEEYTRRKLNALYREIPLKDANSRLLRKYFNAFANFYGIIPLSKAYEIYCEQNKSAVSEDEFLAFSEIAKHECEDYYIICDADIFIDGKEPAPMAYEIVDAALLAEDLDSYIETKTKQQGKPYYVPPKKDLLPYCDTFYSEPTLESYKLCSFLTDDLRIEMSKATAIFAEISFGTRCMNAGLQGVMNRMKELGVSFNDSTVRQFASVYQNFHNNTRMQCNRGYTPHELFEMQPSEDRQPKSISFGPNIRKAIVDGDADINDLRKQILVMNFQNESLRFSLLKELAEAEKEANAKKFSKVGRNESCPCGSGKKYKHCCGKGK